MKLGYVVGFLTPTGVSAGAVVNIDGRESLVVKEPGTGRYVRLFNGQALKIDTCGSSNEFTNAVRTATGVAKYDASINLDNVTVVDLTELSEPKAPKAVKAPKVATKSAKAPTTLTGFKRVFGPATVEAAIKQIRHKKAFSALPIELKGVLKSLIS